MKRRMTGIAIALLLALAGCQGQTEDGLVLPTPLPGATAAATTTPEATPSELPPPPTVAEPTKTVPTATVPTQTAAPTATILPATPADPAATPSGTAEGNYQVAFVELGDVLNVRSGPGVDYPVVAELPRDATGIAVEDTGESLIAGSTWVWAEAEDAAGWVNSRFLTEQVALAEFCDSQAVDRILEDLQTAVADRDGELLAGLVHSERGLRLRHDWWNNEILVRGDAVAELFSSDTVYDWGHEDGSGMPIEGTFGEVMLPLLEEDLLTASETACADIIHGPTAGMTIVPEAYEPVPFVSYHRPAPGEVEFDWGTWVVGVERWEGEYYLAYLVHYDYEI